MRSLRARWPLAALLVAMAHAAGGGCGDDRDHGPGHDHGGGGHEHGGEQEGHHGHGGGDYPAESVTLWQGDAEIFMEWETLTVGRESKFLAHLTDMRDPERFRAVTEGALTVTLGSQGGETVKARVEEPARPGIFTPTLTPTTAGPCRLEVALVSPGLNQTFRIEPCLVVPDEAAARKAAGSREEPAGQIAFLKEQQWPIAFATAGATVEAITPSVTVNARVIPVPGREARLTASTSGRVVLARPAPTLGARVRKGQVLARIQPTVSGPGNLGALRAELSAAKARQAAAKATASRLERLVASDAVPRRRLDDARAALEVAGAELQAARTRLSSYQASAGGGSRAGAGAFRITSPIDGTLVAQEVTEGETIEAGEPLFSVIDLERVWIEGRVFEPDVPRFEGAEQAWFTVEGRDRIFEIGGDNGRLVTVGHVIDPKSRTVPVVFEVQNPESKLRIGQFARLSVAIGKPRRAVVIPAEALIQDGHQSVVFVHVSGEAFERRVVRPGIRSRGLVEIVSGIEAGERVVTVGAYDVKLAASAGQGAAHGHSH